MSSIERVLQSIFQPYKGILAADERPSSMDRRLQEHGISHSAEMRSAYRTLLFSTPNIGRTVSGVILSEDTFENHAINGTMTREYLSSMGIAVGVKVDGGTEPFKGSSELKITKGLDDLSERCKKHKKQGAEFVKWRSVIPAIGATDELIMKVTKDMAEYAWCAISNDLVPIVEPEILLDGKHTADESATSFKKVIAAVKEAISKRGCNVNNCILKTSFIVGGLDGGTTSSEEAAKKTLLTLKEAGLNSKKSFYGIVFLSGGLESKVAIEYIQRIKAIAEKEETQYSFKPPITFSYARALQEPALSAWKGKEENILAAQISFTQTLQHAIKKYKGVEEAPLGSDGKQR